jgi:hypothetical protein
MLRRCGVGTKVIISRFCRVQGAKRIEQSIVRSNCNEEISRVKAPDPMHPSLLALCAMRHALGSSLAIYKVSN